MRGRILLSILLLFALTLTACGPTAAPSEVTDEGASLDKLCEGMVIEESVRRRTT